MPTRYRQSLLTVPLAQKCDWHDLLMPAGENALTFQRGDRVRTLSGGPQMIVVEAGRGEVRCALGAQIYTLPLAVLRRASDARRGTRRGRKVRGVEAVPATASIPEAVFSYETLVEMRNRYNEADRRLNLAEWPELQRKVAIDIIRSFAGAG